MAKRHLYSKDGIYKLFDDESEEYSDKLESGEYFKSKAEAELQDKDIDEEMPEMLETSEFFAKTALLEVVGYFENGDVFAQNNGDESDRWRIPKKVFESTYVKVEGDEDEENLDIPEINPGEDEENEEDEIDLETLSDDELRALAKESGIKSTHNMGRENLIAKLFELSDGEE